MLAKLIVLFVETNYKENISLRKFKILIIFRNNNFSVVPTTDYFSLSSIKVLYIEMIFVKLKVKFVLSVPSKVFVVPSKV